MPNRIELLTQLARALEQLSRRTLSSPLPGCALASPRVRASCWLAWLSLENQAPRALGLTSRRRWRT